ncbi:bifunctional metallophosphatase/5'-nucleotidase [Paenibacillus sp. GCM10012303]|uniref:bifunctional metallophosphatase/5'-nucleotidase n=1 Tax=Paenibacillus sp. GCM10012303 TaxID=3317340 RepID=UPI00361544BD
MALLHCYSGGEKTPQGGAALFQADGQVRITIVETSDLHGSLLPVRYANNSPAESGLAKIATLLRQQREIAKREGGFVLAVDNGDLIQGTPLAYYHARIDNRPADPMVLALSELKFDAAVIGNHEFNYGLDVLNKAIGESAFAWLSANIVREGTEEPAFGRPYVIREFGGATVAVLGLTTPYIPNWENPSHIQGLDFIDAVETAKRWVPYLRDERKADVVVISYHGGFESDPVTGVASERQTGENQGYRLCMEVPGIDVLLTGHQHRELAGLSINGVTIVQPGYLGQQAGIVKLKLGKSGGRWRVADKSSELLSVSGIVPDPDIVALAGPYEAAAQVWLDTPIGTIEGDMTVRDPLLIRTKDNALIEFINKVQMETSGAAISNTALFTDDSPGFPAHVTMRHIVSNYIYPNTLKVIRITGRDIAAALERNATYFTVGDDGAIQINPKFAVPKPQHYNYDMWEGIEYTLDVSRPEGSRVVRLTHRGQPVDPDGEYDVVMNNYRAGGGGDYTMYAGKPVVKDIPIDMSELIASYILERKTVKATVDGNWEVVTGFRG